jgi:hypothetical protein
MRTLHFFPSISLSVLMILFPWVPPRPAIASPIAPQDGPWRFLSQNLAWESSDTVKFYGPSGFGYPGYMVKLQSGIFDANEPRRAVTEGFQVLLCQISDDALRAGSLAALNAELDRASSISGIEVWLYIDDANYFSDERLTYIRDRSPLSLAVSTTDLGWIRAKADWIDANVNVLIPYRYTDDPAEFEDFLSAVESALPTTPLVPCLGYRALKYQGRGVLIDQLGSRSGDGGFLEIAARYAYQGWVCYYSEARQGDPYRKWRREISGYLRRHNYLAPSR